MRLYRAFSQGDDLATTEFLEGRYVPMKAVVVPWCAEHDDLLLTIPKGVCRQGVTLGDYANCRLEEPPRHFKAKEGT